MSKLRASIQLTGTFFSENLTPKSGRHKISVEKMIFGTKINGKKMSYAEY
jgi:hypothetical protein